ncbi:DinB family protein [Hirschia baltica]|uniref:DinB family protein n=1 Tax=Hirschia baltica (strain ATCC 49814 / DSM 5838 / IFAM 1418) TaxID=582402 RepID=C6XRN2_HIRBI|nr:DinB family protein [Hirschia baltica]ACT60642.1 DinB family protein [Hirschia baltica ATCC 49814]
MNLTRNYQQLALYNQWMTTKIYTAIKDLTIEELKKDRGAFFKSIHSTLNHLLWADIRWMNRFTGKTYPIQDGQMGVDLFDDFQTLRDEHFKMAAYIIKWSNTLEENQVSGDLSWKPAWGGDLITKPFWLCITHLFNHQTHHRGQITQMLKPIGIDVGDTDLPLMPK